MVSIFSTAYFPPVSYVSMIRKSETAFIEGCENYQKQSYRSRCYICSSNGPLFLNIPVGRSENARRPIRDVRLDYSTSWVENHQRALVSAYSSTPYFDCYFHEDFKPIYDSRPVFLFDMNMMFLEKVLELCGVSVPVSVTDDYLRDESEDVMIFRDTIHPKRSRPSCIEKAKPYYQIFSDRYGFVEDLSIIDLLFHEGPNSISFL